MKTTSDKSSRETGSRAAAQRAGGSLAAVGPDRGRQPDLREAIDGSPYVAAQRQTLERTFGDALPGPAQKKENKTGIPDEIKTKAEGALNADFSDVRVHPESSRAPEVGALAYTQGNDLHFAPGQFSPASSAGQQLLGHELAHVVQQRQGRVSPTTEVGGMPVNDDPSLEKEADEAGRRV